MKIIKGKVVSVLVNKEPGGSTAQKKIQVFANRGVLGDTHFGATRLADVRETDFLNMGMAKGIEVSNYRQFSAVSQTEVAEIAVKMGIEKIDCGLLGENFVFDIPITKLPVGSTIYFSKPGSEKRTAVLTIMGENMPCFIPGENISKKYPNQKSTMPFAIAGSNLRGVVGIVFSSGFVCEGDEMEIHIKD